MSGREVRYWAKIVADSIVQRGDRAVLAGVRNSDLEKCDVPVRTWQDPGEVISQANRYLSEHRKKIRDKRKERSGGGGGGDDGDLPDICLETFLLVGERVRNGDFYPGGYVGDRYVHLCPEKRGNRSSLAPCLRTYVAKTHEGRFWTERTGKKTICGGDNKAFIGPIPSKISALDAAYNDFNGDMRGVLRLDIDKDFPSEADLSRKILELGCPLPNFFVHEGKEDGRVVRPHLYYILKDSVCFTENGRQKPKSLFWQVYHALYLKLAPIGADANATNGTRGKNPLSRLWRTVVVHQEPYSLGRSPDGLESLAELLEVHKHQRQIWVPSFFAGAGADVEQQGSNALFSTAGLIARRLIHFYHPDSRRWMAVLAEEKARPRDELYAEFKHVLKKKLESYFGDTSLVRKQAESTAKFYWTTFNPARLSEDRRRGVMRREPSYLQARSTQERQQAGARYSSRLRRDKALIQMAEAAEMIGSPGEEIAPTALARVSGLSRQTIWRHKDHHPEARRLLTEYRARGSGNPEELLMIGRSAGTSEVNSDRNIEWLDKRVLVLPGDREASGTGDAKSDGESITQKAGLSSSIDPARTGEFRTRMGEGARSYEPHAKNPVFLMSIGAGFEGDTVTMIPLDPNIPPMVFEAVIAQAISHIDDFGREFMGREDVINGLDGSVAWRNPDLLRLDLDATA